MPDEFRRPPDGAPARSGWRRLAGDAGRVVVVVVAAMAVLAALLTGAGFDASASLTSLWRGAAGSTDAILSATLVRAVPLLLIGTGMVIALRGGVINVGGDGQLLAGATATIVVATWLPAGAPATLAGLAAAAAGGALWTAVPAWLKSRFGTLEVVSTIMMNFIALHAVSFLVRGPLQEPSGVYPQSASVPAGTQLPLLLAGTRLHAGLVIAMIAAVIAWVVLERRASGFRLRAVGSNPRAAAVAGGIDVSRVQVRAFLTSGALAGLAGGVEVLGVTFALYENLSPGYGYTAIAVALLARLRVSAAVWSAVLFGGLAAGTTAMQRDAGVPAGAAAAIEATIILLLLAGQALALRWRPLAFLRST